MRAHNPKSLKSHLKYPFWFRLCAPVCLSNSSVESSTFHFDLLSAMQGTFYHIETGHKYPGEFFVTLLVGTSAQGQTKARASRVPRQVFGKFGNSMLNSVSTMPCRGDQQEDNGDV